jgi:hypothetical protein
MLKIICGEDSVASRKRYTDLIQEYIKKGYYIAYAQPNQIEEIGKNMGGETMLFNEKKVYFMQNLTSFTARKKDKAFTAVLQGVISNPSLEVIDWEDGKGSRDIKIKTPDIEEYKPSQTIFQFLDLCYPGNLIPFVASLNEVLKTQEEGFVYTMLHRHIRTLVLAATRQLPASVPVWMKKKHESQAQKWNTELLVGFYDGLARIDSGLKTNANIYGIKKSIELLAVYFLK